MRNLKVIIADDQKMIRKALGLLILNLQNIRVIGEASNGMEVLEMLSRHSVHIVLLDLDMPNMNGFETARIINEKYPWTKIIVITMSNEAASAKKMLKLNASGYLTKTEDHEVFFKALEVVSNGGKYISPAIEALLESEEVPDETQDKLTSREQEIVHLIRSGLSSKEISDKLFLSVKTINSHRSNIYKKLNVKNIAGLIQMRNKSLL